MNSYEEFSEIQEIINKLGSKFEEIQTQAPLTLETFEASMNPIHMEITMIKKELEAFSKDIGLTAEAILKIMRAFSEERERNISAQRILLKKIEQLVEMWK